VRANRRNFNAGSAQQWRPFFEALGVSNFLVVRQRTHEATLSLDGIACLSHIVTAEGFCAVTGPRAYLVDDWFCEEFKAIVETVHQQLAEIAQDEPSEKENRVKRALLEKMLKVPEAFAFVSLLLASAR